jgi:hypothetical protein
LGKLCIASLTTLASFLLIENSDIVEVQSPVTPLVIIFLLSYSVGAIFVSVFTIAANTIMQCFLVDLEVHGENHAGILKKRPAALDSYRYQAQMERD